MFKTVKEILSKIISLFFINDLKFLPNRNFIQKVIISLKKTGKIISKYEFLNVVIYNIAQIKNKKPKDEILAIELIPRE